MKTLLFLLLVASFAVALLPIVPVAADEDAGAAPVDAVLLAQVDEALVAAGENRGELETVLAHYAEQPQELAAARFLIANMPGKGYVRTRLRDKQGNTIAFDPLAYETLELAHQRLDALEKEHGELEFGRDDLVEDVGQITAAFLIHHIDGSFAAWKAIPETERVSFDAFLHYVLPYRGSQEPIDDWLTPLKERLDELRTELGPDASREALYKAFRKASRLKFNDRYYLHPTDQGYGEMCRSGYGRCEDITNMATFVARTMAVAIAADYTPAWAHRDNNHAWPIHLDRHGRGFGKGQAHAAKIYRKTYEIQRDALAFQLPEGKEAPNRFLSSRTYIDVTNQYAATTDVTVALTAPHAKAGFAYLCVFNGGNWVAIHWSRVKDGEATFTDMGRNICYLPAVFEDGALVPAAAPLIVHHNGMIQRLPGDGGGADLLVVATSPSKQSPDTGAVTPTSLLSAGEAYVLQRFTPSG